MPPGYVRDPMLFVNAESTGVRDGVAATQSLIDSFQAPLEAAQTFARTDYLDAAADAQRFETQYEKPLAVELKRLEIQDYGNKRLAAEADLLNKQLDALKKGTDLKTALAVQKRDIADAEENTRLVETIDNILTPQVPGGSIADDDIVEASRIMGDTKSSIIFGRKSAGMDVFSKSQAQALVTEFEGRPNLKAQYPKEYQTVRKIAIGPEKAAAEDFDRTKLKVEYGVISPDEAFGDQQPPQAQGAQQQPPPSAGAAPTTQGTPPAAGGSPAPFGAPGGQQGQAQGDPGQAQPVPTLSPRKQQFIDELRASGSPMVDVNGDPLEARLGAQDGVPTVELPPPADRKLTPAEPGKKYPFGVTTTIIGNFPSEQVNHISTPHLVNRREYVERIKNEEKIKWPSFGKLGTIGSQLEAHTGLARMAEQAYERENAKGEYVVKRYQEDPDEKAKLDKVAYISQNLDTALATLKRLGKEDVLGPGIQQNIERTLTEMSQSDDPEDMEVVSALAQIKEAIIARKALTSSAAQELNTNIEATSMEAGYPTPRWTYGNLVRFNSNAKKMNLYARARVAFYNRLKGGNGGYLGAEVFDDYIEREVRNPKTGQLDSPGSASPYQIAEEALRHRLGSVTPEDREIINVDGQPGEKPPLRPTPTATPTASPTPLPTAAPTSQPEQRRAGLPTMADAEARFEQERAGKPAPKKPKPFIERVGDALVPDVEAEEVPSARRPKPTPPPPLPPSTIKMVEEAGAKYDVPPELVLALIEQESTNGANRGPSPAGALGLGQVLPRTAASIVKPNASEKEWNRMAADPAFKDKLRNNDKFNIMVATKHFANIWKDNKGDVIRAVQEYNQGSGNMRKNALGGQEYALGVFEKLDRLRAESGGPDVLAADFEKKNESAGLKPREVSLPSEDSRFDAAVDAAIEGSPPPSADTPTVVPPPVDESPARKRRRLAEAEALTAKNIVQSPTRTFLRKFPELQKQYDEDPEFQRAISIRLDKFLRVGGFDAAKVSLNDQLTYGMSQPMLAAGAELADVLVQQVSGGQSLPYEFYRAAVEEQAKLAGDTWPGTIGGAIGYLASFASIFRLFGLVGKGITAARASRGLSVAAKGNEKVEKFKTFLKLLSTGTTTDALQAVGHDRDPLPAAGVGAGMQILASGMYVALSRASKPTAAIVGGVAWAAWEKANGGDWLDTLEGGAKGVIAGATAKTVLNIGGRMGTGKTRAEINQVPDPGTKSGVRELSPGESALAQAFSKTPTGPDDLAKAVKEVEGTANAVIDPDYATVQKVASESLSNPANQGLSGEFAADRANRTINYGTRENIARAAISEGVPPQVVDPALTVGDRQLALTAYFEPLYDKIFSVYTYAKTRIKDKEVLAKLRQVIAADKNRFNLVDDAGLEKLAQDPKIDALLAKEAKRIGDVEATVRNRRYDVWQGVAQELKERAAKQTAIKEAQQEIAKDTTKDLFERNSAPKKATLAEQEAKLLTAQAKEIKEVLSKKQPTDRLEAVSYAQRGLKGDQTAVVAPQENTGGAGVRSIGKKIDDLVATMESDAPGWSAMNKKYVQASESMKALNEVEGVMAAPGIPQDKTSDIAKKIVGSAAENKELVEKLGQPLVDKLTVVAANHDKAFRGTALARNASRAGSDSSGQLKAQLVAFGRRMWFSRKAAVDSLNFVDAVFGLGDAELNAQAKLLLAAGTEKAQMTALKNIADVARRRQLALPGVAEMEKVITGAAVGSQGSRIAGGD